MRMNWMSLKQYKKRLLYIGIAAALTFSVACSNMVETNQYDNVHTYMTEYEPDKYKVDSELVILDTISLVTLYKLDGTRETMQFDKVKELYNDKDPMEAYDDKNGSMNQSYCNNHMGELYFILFWSNYGYHLGRPYDVPVYRGAYRNETAYRNANTTQTKVVSSRKSITVSKTSTKAPIKSTSKYGGTSSKSYSTGNSGGGKTGGSKSGG